MPTWDSAGVGAISEIPLLSSRAHLRSAVTVRAANRHTPVLRCIGFIEASPSIAPRALRNGRYGKIMQSPDAVSQARRCFARGRRCREKDDRMPRGALRYAL